MKHAILNINELPSIEELIHNAKALALLDAILMVEWEYRYFSFDKLWNIEENEMMASMRDGEGNEYFILFSEFGVIGKVFDNSIINKKEDLLKFVPGCFQSFIEEPAFDLNRISYLFWRRYADVSWTNYPNSLNCYPLLKFLTKGVNYYYSWAENYYEKKIDFNALKIVFDDLLINKKIIKKLNYNIDMNDLMDDLEEII